MCLLNSNSCAISDPETDTIVVTGGLNSKKVSVYNTQGWQEDLADLNYVRFGHACTSFTSVDQKVRS